MHQAKDNDELLSFLLGQLVKEKVQLYRHQRGDNPPSVRVSVAQLEARAKELEIYDPNPFLQSKLFRANGYKIVGEGGERAVEKVFRRAGDDEI